MKLDLSSNLQTNYYELFSDAILSNLVKYELTEVLIKVLVGLKS